MIGVFVGIDVFGLPGATTTTPVVPPDGSIAPASFGVLYEVSGDAARALVTYGISDRVSQVNGVSLPWTTMETPGDDTDVYTLTAQSSSNEAGQISCRITVNGEVIAEQASSGQYSEASCVGTVSTH